MLIDFGVGMLSYMEYLGELQMAEAGHGDMLRETWKAKRKAEKMTFVCQEGNPIKAATKSLGGNQSYSIAVVNLRGTMRSEAGLSSPGIDSTIADLRNATANQSVKGIILNTSSGGGEVEAANRLVGALQDCKQVKPIVQFINGVCASGATMAGVVCDERIANGEMAEDGSIGVTIQLDKPTIEYMKENSLNLYSKYSADKHSMFKSIMDGDFQSVVENDLDPIALAFQKLVKKNRKGVDASALTGNMFLAPKAKDLKLIDRIGTFNTAVERVNILARRMSRANGARRALQK